MDGRTRRFINAHTMTRQPWSSTMEVSTIVYRTRYYQISWCCPITHWLLSPGGVTPSPITSLEIFLHMVCQIQHHFLGPHSTLHFGNNVQCWSQSLPHWTPLLSWVPWHSIPQWSQPTGVLLHDCSLSGLEEGYPMALPSDLFSPWAISSAPIISTSSL